MANVKLNPNKSRFAKPLEEKKDFENQAKELVDLKEKLNQEVFELGQNFLEIVSDRTLKENKTEITKEKEKAIVQALNILTTRLNNDLSLLEGGQEGMGSVVACGLLSACILMMRDRINQLEYEVELLKNSAKVNQK